MTYAEYVAIANDSELKYEYVAGEVVAMAGGNRRWQLDEHVAGDRLRLESLAIDLAVDDLYVSPRYHRSIARVDGFTIVASCHASAPLRPALRPLIPARVWTCRRDGTCSAEHSSGSRDRRNPIPIVRAHTVGGPE